MTSITATDVHSQLVQMAAEEIDHIYCGFCGDPDGPVMCGTEDIGGTPCPEDCEHTTCSMCQEEWDLHWCPNMETEASA